VTSLVAGLLVSGKEISSSELPEGVEGLLVAGGFLISPDFDELAAIRRRYWSARQDAPAVLTITTTLECNLACYYCYEERQESRLAPYDVPAVVMQARRAIGSERRPLHVCWYGGEPMLNLDFLESASLPLQRLASELGVKYSASILSNGTGWPDDAGAFVRRHSIRQVQISFDGLAENHNRRRHERGGARRNTFAEASALVDRLMNHVRVDLRFNCDRANSNDLLGFIEYARGRGWFGGSHPAVLQPARVDAFSERVGFLRKHVIKGQEFDLLRSRARNALAGEGRVDEAELPSGRPLPRNSVCAALGPHSTVLGSDRRLYRCGLQVSEPHRATGRLTSGHGLPIVSNPDDAGWWAEFDPTRQPACSRCSFLPICWGGCPKKHLDGDRAALDEQGAYWRRNLGRHVLSAVGLDASHCSAPLDLTSQFRGDTGGFSGLVESKLPISSSAGPDLSLSCFGPTHAAR